MRAAVITAAGKVGVEDWPDPVAGDGEVLIKLRRAALNRRDWFLLGDPAAVGLELPTVIGSDGAGVIEALGSGVSGLVVGQEVVILPEFNWGESEEAPGPDFELLGASTQGTHAESIVVPAESAYPRPQRLTWEESAALPLASLTAWRALFKRGGLESGQTVLITGASGGVSTYAIQIAAASGARVLNENTAAEMHKLHAAQGSTRSGMGLGFRVTYANGRRTICHGGDGSGFTALIGAHPDERVGVALLINTGGAQTARSVIGNTALALLAGDTPPRRQKSAPPLTTGVYRSTYWDIEIEARDGGAPTLVCTEGLLVREDPTDSRLDGTPEGRLEGVGGLFHGFEIDLEDSDPPQVMGGVYPFTFVRTGELPTGAATVDEHILLGGKWSGTVRTPLGAMVATLTVNDERSMAITTPLGVDHQIENADARSGRVEGEFSLSLPGVGEHRCFLRLAAIGGALTGKIYARGRFGEAAMPTDLTRV